MARTKKPPKEKKANGRPSSFSQEIADEICEALVTPIQDTPDGPWRVPTLRSVCAKKGPEWLTKVMRWLAEPRNDKFREQYVRACETAHELRVGELPDIANEMPTETTTVTSKGGNEYTTTRIDNAGIQRNRLRIDTIKWLASKSLPKKYGDRVEVGTTDGLAAVLASLKPPIADK